MSNLLAVSSIFVINFQSSISILYSYYKTQQLRFLKVGQITGKILKRLFGSRQHLHAKYWSIPHDNLPPVLSDLSLMITLPPDV